MEVLAYLTANPPRRPPSRPPNARQWVPSPDLRDHNTVVKEVRRLPWLSSSSAHLVQYLSVQSNSLGLSSRVPTTCLPWRNRWFDRRKDNPEKDLTIRTVERKRENKKKISHLHPNMTLSNILTNDFYLSFAVPQLRLSHLPPSPQIPTLYRSTQLLAFPIPNSHDPNHAPQRNIHHRT